MSTTPPPATISSDPFTALTPAAQKRAIFSCFGTAFLVSAASIWFALGSMGGIDEMVCFAAYLGSFVSITSRLLDHAAFTMNIHARRKTNWWDGAYLATRISIGGALGIAAAYTTMAIQAGLGTTDHAPLLPVVAAFAASYAFKAQPIALK